MRSTAVLQWQNDGVTAFRMFLRFLTATGRSQPGLEAAIPTMAAWRLATYEQREAPEALARKSAQLERMAALARAPEKPPNVVVILFDDLGRLARGHLRLSPRRPLRVRGRSSDPGRGASSALRNRTRSGASARFRG